jgi:hypothetical protein
MFARNRERQVHGIHRGEGHPLHGSHMLHPGNGLQLFQKDSVVFGHLLHSCQTPHGERQIKGKNMVDPNAEVGVHLVPEPVQGEFGSGEQRQCKCEFHYDRNLVVPTARQPCRTAAQSFKPRTTSRLTDQGVPSVVNGAGSVACRPSLVVTPTETPGEGGYPKPRTASVRRVPTWAADGAVESVPLALVLTSLEP